MASEMWFDWDREIRTAEDWDTCGMARRMVESLTGHLERHRKFYFFGVACCRSVWHLLEQPSRDCVEATERFVESDLTSSFQDSR
jgi:hypothetical protein